MIPLEVRLHEGRTRLEITWERGDVTSLSAAALRQASRAADAVRAALEGVVPAADEQLRLTEIQPIGNYALHLSFSDGHDRGIYPWAYLRELAAAEPV
jgi:DUF971 family protein